MDLIQTGLEKGYIKFDETKSFVTYIHQNKKRNFNNPEEKVQVEAFLSLILIYGYKVERIRNFIPVRMGSDTKEADIIVYSDNKCESTYIVVECKKEEITDQEFNKAVDQAYSYAVAEGAKYVWITSRLKNEYYEVPPKKPKSRISISDIPSFGIDELAPYKYVKGGLLRSDLIPEKLISELSDKLHKQKFFDIEAISESELTKIFIQSHQSLWGGGHKNPSVAFDELDKLIFCKIWDEKYTIDSVTKKFRPRKDGEPYQFQIFMNEKPKDMFERINKIYEKGREKDPEVFKEDINLTPEETLTIIKYFQRINLSKTDLDSKGKAFETFMGSYFRGDFGQYFTPRAIVKFIVDSLPIDNNSKVLDTSCGSGGFLLYALDKVRTLANEYYPIDEKENYIYWHDFAEKNLYGIEINEQIARTAKMNMIIHDDGHTNVIAADGLLNDEDLKKKSKNKNFIYSNFDFIITNPPFGSNIKQTEKAYLHQYRLGIKEYDWLSTKGINKPASRDSQSTEILFLEQCHRFLKPLGYLAIVIPDGILTNSSLQYVRDNIEELYRIIAVVSLPQTAFTANGAGVKSSVLFLRKHKEKTSENILNQKLKLKENLKSDAKYIELIEKWEKGKNILIKKLMSDTKKINHDKSKKEIDEIIKSEKSILQSQFTEKVNNLKEEMTEKYFIEKQKLLDDYRIFMAIAEDIGYDATGRATGKNELIEIGNELSRFIEFIEKSEG